jgi:hypothetical protein
VVGLSSMGWPLGHDAGAEMLVPSGRRVQVVGLPGIQNKTKLAPIMLHGEQSKWTDWFMAAKHRIICRTLFHG